MKRVLLLGGAVLALSSSLAMAQPESLLPDFFDDPPPEQPTPAPSAPVTAPDPGGSIQPSIPDAPALPADSAPAVPSYPSLRSIPRAALPEDFPSLEELEEMEESEINDLFGLRPKFDVPPTARRATENIGVINASEGGFAAASLANQPAELVRAALSGTRGPMVSRWGHIVLRRALASRMDAPRDMDAVEFAALRAALLNRIGEAQLARTLVQDIDTDNYDAELTGAAFDAYLATGDVLGICPVAQLKPTIREDAEWSLVYGICEAYAGNARGGERRLQRALGEGEADEIDVRLAQRYAGAAGEAGRAVNIEWSGVEALTPWRFGLARALGAELPDTLRNGAAAHYDLADALIPAVPMVDRINAASLAGQRGVLSSAAMVDLYSQLYASEVVSAGDRQPALVLREAYVADTAADRLAAMRSLWGDSGEYGHQVLTAYAAARLPVSADFEEDAGDIIASILTAGLDRNAMLWGSLVPEGSIGWGQLVLAQEDRANPVPSGALGAFIDNDMSAERRKSQFLLAGLAALDRLDGGAVDDVSARLDVDLSRTSVWSDRISTAAEHGNAPLVALLAGVGMQGDSWDSMTARHLYYIVRSLNSVGLEAEARMIAAEAVARG